MKIHLSFFQFLIGGHYLVDVALLKWKDYKDNRLEFKRFKNRHKLNGGEMVSVKVFKTAKAIIKMYGTKKTERIFGFIPDPIKNPTQYRTFQRNINRSYVSYLKETKLNNYNFTSRTPRYIFRTTAGNMQLSDLIIMQIQGHKAHGITYTYQSKIPLQTQDKHHKKIIELVKKYF